MNQLYRLTTLLCLLFVIQLSFAATAGKNIPLLNAVSAHAAAPGDLSAIITGDSIFCAGSASAMIVFEAAGGSAPYTFTYQVDGGTIRTAYTTGVSNSADVPVNATAAGQFSYRITSVKGATGKTTAVDISRLVTIRTAPVVDFSFTGAACSGSPVRFTPSVQGAGMYSYLWDFGDGFTSTEQDPSHVFSSMGCGTSVFTVSLTVTDSNGCSTKRSGPITVLQKPDISFSDLNFPFGDPFNNCGSASAASPNYSINVGNTSLSAGCITSYSIDWGDGSAPVANATFPAGHTYTRLGAFEMVVTAYGSNGCNNTITYVVRNLNNPSVGITSPGTTTNLCAPTAPLGFEIAKWGTNSPGTTYRVDYGDGSPILTFTQEELKASPFYVASNPSASANYPIPHSYLLPNCPNGPYMVRLTATNACSSTEATVNNITVFNKTTPDFTAPAHACVNSTVTFTNTSVPGYNPSCTQMAIYTWDFGDGTAQEVTSPTLPKNTSHTYTIPGQYTIKLTTRNICGESVKTQVITIDPPLTATVSGPGMVSGTVNVCEGVPLPVITLTGTNGTAPYTFTYRINNGPLQTVTTAPGSSSVTVQLPAGTTGSITYTLMGVSDASPSSCSQPQTGSVTVVVAAPPSGDISGNQSACLNGASPQVTFTGSGGTRPYTFTYTLNGGAAQTITTSTTSNSVSIAVPTTTAGVFRYTLVGIKDAGAGSCSRTLSEMAVITISQPPAPMILPNYEYCNGETTAVIPFSNTVSGTTYRWTNSNTSIGLAANGNGSIPSFTARNSTGAPIAATITVTPSVNGCDGIPQTFILTVHPSAVIFSRGAQTICSGDDTEEVTLSSPTGAVLSWSVIAPAGLTGVVTSGTNTIPVQTLVNTTSVPLMVSYTAMAALPASAPCAGTTYRYTIIVNPRPSIRQIFSTAICSASAFTVSPQGSAENSIPSGTRYTWSMPVISPAGAITGASAQASPQASISQTLVNTTSAAATATYTVTPVANGCAGITFTIVVTVLPLPTAIISGGATVCQDAGMPQVTFTGSNGTAPYTFTYRINNGPTRTITTPSGSSAGISVPTTIAGTFTYTLVSVQDAGGLGCMQPQSGSAVVTVQPLPTATLTGDATVCSNSTSPQITFTGSGGTRPYTFTYNLNGGIAQTISTNATSGSVTLSVPTTAAGVFQYNLTGVKDASAGTCSRTVNASASVTVKEAPAAMTLSDYEYCNGEATVAINFSNPVAGTTYTWSNSNTAIGLPASGTGSIASFTALNATGLPITSTITVTPSVNGCNGPSQNVKITVQPSPVVIFSAAPQTICSGESSAVISLTGSTAGVQFSWSAVQPAGITGVVTSGTSIIPVQTLVNSTGSPITVTYKAIATTSGAVSCTGNEATYTITVNPTAVIGEAFAQNICSGSAFNISPQNNTSNTIPMGTMYIWSVPLISPSGAITGASAQAVPQAGISQRLVNTTSAVATATYRITPVVNGCAGEAFTVVVTVLPAPTMSAVNDIILCHGEQVPSVVFTGSVTGTLYRWTNDNPSIGLAGSGTGNIAPFAAVNTASVPVKATISVTPFSTDGSLTCDAAPLQFRITVNPGAQVDPVEDIRVCSGNPVAVSFTTPHTAGSTTFEWTSSNTAIGLGASGSGNFSFVGVNTGNTAISAVVTVTPVNTDNGVSCKGNPEAFTITVDPAATVVRPPDQELCNGYLTQEVVFTGNNPNALYRWTTDNVAIGLPAAGTGTIQPFRAVNNGTAPDVATVTVTPVINGCSGTPVSFNITVNPTPVITLQPAGSVVCLGERPATLSVAVTGVGSPSYQWYSNTSAGVMGAVLLPGATTASYDPPATEAGTRYYYCRITFATKDCNTLTTAVAAVVIQPRPVISATDREISSGETFTVVPTWDNGNIVPPGTAYVWSAPVVSPAGSVSGATAQTEPQAVISQRLFNTTSQAATVTYTVTPVAGACSGASFKVTVVVDAPLVANVSVQRVPCFGSINGSITTSIQGGSPFAGPVPYTISWSGPDGYTSSAPGIYNLAPGVYFLSVKDARGKEFSAHYTMTAPEELVVVTDEKQDVSNYGAADGSISITVKGGTPPYRTAWTKDNMLFANTEDITGLTPGTYTVTVTDANDCGPRMLSYRVDQLEPLSLSLARTSSIPCYGDSTGSIAVGVTGGTMLETAPGVYGYRYRWNGPDGFTSPEKDLSGLMAGDYTLTVTDGAGESRSLAVTLTQPSPLAVVVQTTPISCYGANNATISLEITGGTPPYQAKWNNYATGTYQDNLSAGDYTILITDGVGCQTTTTVHIPEAPVFRVNPEVKNVTCYGAKNGSISLNFETTLKSVILVWSDNVRSGATRNNIGPGTYTVRIQGGDLCMINHTFVITEPAPLLVAGEVTDITDCNLVEGGGIDLMVTGGTPPYRYAWSNGAVTQDLSNLQAGSYAITVTDSMGCAQVAQYTVRRPLPLDIEVETTIDNNCVSGELKAINTAIVSGGVTPYRLQWSAGTVSGLNNERMETRQSGIVVLTVTDQTGCTAMRSFSVTLPRPGITTSLLDCQAHTFLFNGVPAVESPSATYSWDFGDGTTSNLRNPQHTYREAGTYHVRLTVSGAGNCVNVYNDMVNAAAPPMVGIDKEPQFCPGDSVLVYGTGAATYRWNDGTTGDSIWISREGNYRVTGISASGCEATFDFRASYFDLIGYSIHSDQEEVSQGASRIRLWSQNIPFSNYGWDFGDGHTGQGAEVFHSYEITDDGYFDVTLTVINPNGCVEKATKRIWKSASAIVNTFTPNSDGINDIYLKGWQIEVFNRNGILMYKGDTGWDGRHNGRPVDNDTYFVIIYDSSRLGAEYKKSYVTVLR